MSSPSTSTRSCGWPRRWPPDLAGTLLRRARTVEGRTWEKLWSRAPASPVLAIGPALRAGVLDVLTAPTGAPIVVLEEPRHPGNVGAAIRVAAAAGAAAVLTSGTLDPWTAPVVRSAAGLHYALRVGQLPGAVAGLDTERQVVALDPAAEPLDPAELEPGTIFVFGGERHGLRDATLERADRRWGLPMRAGVSSLNLATSVAATLYQLKSPGRSSRWPAPRS